ncbi:MAG: SAM-dependent methyltransferase, partial [Betaproteobacteria bacterium]|nr:SAM-dependent methyltransferase [Betaproteobacteria bacterium]
MAMLKAANTQASDVVYDLGSGDGVIPILAAKHFGS